MTMSEGQTSVGIDGSGASSPDLQGSKPVRRPLGLPLPLRSGRFGFALAVLTILCLTTSISPSLALMVQMWQGGEYGHAWLIAPLAVLIFIHRFSDADHGGQRWGAVMTAVLAVGVIFAGRATGSSWFSIYGAIIGLYGLVWSSVGLRGMWVLTAPIIYLFFMIPLPLASYLTVTTEMQLLSSKLGVALMEAVGLSVFLDGNIIDLGVARLEVAEACNGLRYLFPLISFGFLIATLLHDALWKKILIVVSTIPIAIGINAARIMVIGILVERFGIGAAEGTQHEVEGFLVFLLCVALILIEVQVIRRLGHKGRFLPLAVLIPTRRTRQAVTSWPTGKPLFAASAALLVGALTLIALPQRTEVIPDRRPLVLFPMDLSVWRGTPQSLDPDTLDALKLTDYTLANYVRSGVDDRTPVNFYVAYYESQKFGVQAHSPKLCIPGGGWDIVAQSIVDLPAPNGDRFPVNRVVIEKQGISQLVYYWFVERGRRMTDEYQIKYYGLRDAVMMQRSDGGLVRVVTPIVKDDEANADRRLEQFVQDSGVVLEKFIPN